MSGGRGAPARRAAGFTLVELAVSVAVMVVLVAVLLQRVQFYQAEAERAAVVETVGMLRTALYVKTAMLRATRHDAELAALAGSNPMDWLSRKSDNYLGVYFAPNPADLPLGNWYFDRKRGELVYLLNSPIFIREIRLKRLKFKVILKPLTAPQASPPGRTAAIGVVDLDQVND